VAARETAAAARANGIELTDERAVEALETVVEATAANESSMYQDLQRERRTEIDAINGAVVDRAEGPTPVNETLAALVRTWERERNLR
jgi:2-dehydropantoate 2-reductase